MPALIADHLPLQKLYHWEKALADRPYLTQPLGGGRERTWTWAQALEEARRMAAYLQGPELGGRAPAWRSSPRTAPGGCWRITPS